MTELTSLKVRAMSAIKEKIAKCFLQNLFFPTTIRQDFQIDLFVHILYEYVDWTLDTELEVHGLQCKVILSNNLLLQ